MAAKRSYVFALATTSVREPGTKYPTTVQEGTIWHADCQMVQDNPDLFSSDPPAQLIHPRNWTPPVEETTAAPGTRRTTKRAD